MSVEAQRNSVEPESDRPEERSAGRTRSNKAAMLAAAGLSVQELIEANDTLGALFSQMHHYGWEFDLRSHRFTPLEKKSGSSVWTCSQTITPEDLIARGIVHHTSLEPFRVFVRKLLGGERAGGATLMLRPFKNTSYEWYTVSYRMLFDSEKHPAKAVGILYRATDIDDQPLYIRYAKARGDLLTSLCGYMLVNLRTGELRKHWQADRNQPPASELMSYETKINEFVGMLFTPSARARVAKTLGLEALRKRAAGHLPCWSFEITRFVESASYIRPIAIHVLYDRADASSDPYAFIYAQYVDKLYEKGGEEYIRCEREPDSGLLTETGAESLASKYYADEANQRAHAVVRIYDEKDLSSERFAFIAGAFSLFFEHKALVNPLGRNSLGIFIPNCESASKARSEIENAFAFARRFIPLRTPNKIRFVSAFTHGHLREQYRKVFLTHAMDACDRLQADKSSDAIEYLPSLSDIRAAHEFSLLPETFNDGSIPTDSSKTLTNDEQQLLLKSLDGIVTAPSSEVALLRILELVGRYYAADRVYTVRLVDNMRSVEQVCEWNGGEKALFKGLMSGTALERFPLFDRVVKSGKPVFIEKIKRAVPLVTAGDESGTWSFAVLPFKSEKFFGLFCIDNPTEQLGRLALPEALAPYLVGIHEKVLKERYDFVSSADLSPHIWRGLSTYQSRIGSITADGYISMGALVVAVPGMLALENENGVGHCATMLRFLSELLSRCFANSMIFNPFDQEFVILSPNTTKELFFDRVTQVRELCQRSYDNQIALGATWSKNYFTGPELVTEARTIMLSQKDDSPRVADSGKAPRMPSVHLPISQFTVFYQPKVDMKTKKVIGAEALARGIDDRGMLVQPGRFIGVLEREGQLRALDLFVLSRVLWQLTQWKRAGRKLVPVSVNFSRFTLFDHSTVGAVLALLSNYDEVDPSLIEIEITETACSVEDETLNQAMKPYQEQGIRFALDDFGTGYANLSIFSKVHFDTVKLDRSLIKDLNSSVVGRSLVESIVQISHDSNTLVVAEGVEENDQADILLERGCHLAQGHLYERPLDAELFTQKYLTTATA